MFRPNLNISLTNNFKKSWLSFRKNKKSYNENLVKQKNNYRNNHNLIIRRSMSNTTFPNPKNNKPNNDKFRALIMLACIGIMLKFKENLFIYKEM